MTNDYDLAVIWSFGHLSKSKTHCQIRHYNINILFIYSEQWPRFRNRKWPKWPWPNDHVLQSKMMSLTHQKYGSCMGKSTRAQFCAVIPNLPITEYTVTLLVYMEPAWVKVCKSNFRLTSLFAVIWSFGHLSKSKSDCQKPAQSEKPVALLIPPRPSDTPPNSGGEMECSD